MTTWWTYPPLLRVQCVLEDVYTFPNDGFVVSTKPWRRLSQILNGKRKLFTLFLKIRWLCCSYSLLNAMLVFSPKLKHSLLVEIRWAQWLTRVINIFFKIQTAHCFRFHLCTARYAQRTNSNVCVIDKTRTQVPVFKNVKIFLSTGRFLLLLNLAILIDTGCAFDYIEVYDCPGTYSPKLGKCCG